MPDILQEAKVGIYLKDDCQTMWDGVAGATINDGHICVGEKGERGACSVSGHNLQNNDIDKKTAAPFSKCLKVKPIFH